MPSPVGPSPLMPSPVRPSQVGPAMPDGTEQHIATPDRHHTDPDRHHTDPDQHPPIPTGRLSAPTAIVVQVTSSVLADSSGSGDQGPPGGGQRAGGDTAAQASPRVPRGVLGLPGHLPYRVTRTAPSPGLGWCIDRFWTSEWELPPGRAVTARVLPHPTVNLTLESTPTSGPQLIITGVARGVFTRTLTGTDRAFGIKLRPGVARLLIDVPVAELSGDGQPATAPAGAPVMPRGRLLWSALLDAQDDAARIAATETFLSRLPGPSEKLMTVQRAVRSLIGDPAVRRVSDVTGRLGVSERTLQRLFGEYLGLTPGWVLRRGRLHAAAERLIHLTMSGTRRAALAEVATEYGYADQAHLTGDFTKIIGMPPNSWLNSLIAEHAAD